MSYADKAIGPDGIRPYAEIAEAELRAKTAAQNAQKLSAQEVEARKSETQKLVENTQRMYDEARHNNNRAQLSFWKNQLEQVKEKLASEQAAEAKVKAFAADRRIALIREEADAIHRSGAHLLPHASQIDRDNLVAIARSNDYPTPEAQYRDFKELSDRLTDVELEAERIKQSDAQIEAARQELTAATSRVQQSELEMMRAKREGVASE